MNTNNTIREYKFRGKRIDNGKWIYGSLITKTLSNEEHIFILIEDSDFFRSLWELLIEVDPETVGQYTEKKDKNGKEICDGDICKFNNPTVPVCVVRYFRDKACFGLSDEKNWFNLPFKELVDNVEILGTIHDNPELLNKQQT